MPVFLSFYQLLSLEQLSRNTKTCRLLDISLNVLEREGPVKLKELLQSTYTASLPSCLHLETHVLSHGAVISNNRLLVDTGDFVRIDDQVSKHIQILHIIYNK